MRMAVRPTRWAWASSWLTQIMARSAFSVSQRSINCSTAEAVGLSRADVGSSRSKIVGSSCNARTRAVIWISPPESSATFFSRKAASRPRARKQIHYSVPIKLPLSMNIQGIWLAQGGLDRFLNQGRSLMKVDNRLL